MASDDIRGTIIDETGTEIEGATVYLFSDDAAAEADLVATTTTDANGEYQFEVYPDGSGATRSWHVAATYEDGTGDLFNMLSKPRVDAALEGVPDSTVLNARASDLNTSTGVVESSIGPDLEPKGGSPSLITDARNGYDAIGYAGDANGNESVSQTRVALSESDPAAIIITARLRTIDDSFSGIVDGPDQGAFGFSYEGGTANQFFLNRGTESDTFGYSSLTTDWHVFAFVGRNGNDAALLLDGEELTTKSLNARGIGGLTVGGLGARNDSDSVFESDLAVAEVTVLDNFESGDLRAEVARQANKYDIQLSTAFREVPDSGRFRYTYEDTSVAETVTDVWRDNDGFVNGDPTLTATGANDGSALNLDGSGDFVDTGVKGDYSSSFTVATYAYFDSLASSTYVLASGLIDALGYFDGLGEFGVVLDDESDGSIQATEAASNISTGTLYHLAFVYGADAEQIRYYRDGSRIASASTSGAVINDRYNWTIGSHPRDDSDYLDGRVDQTDYYNRALSDAQVSNLFETGRVQPIGAQFRFPLDASAPTDVWGDRDVSIAGGVTTGVPGANQTYDTSSAYSLDGTDGEITSPSAFDATDGWAVGFWVYLDSTIAADAGVFETVWGAGAASEYVRAVYDGSDLDLRVRGADGSSTEVTLTDPSPALDAWAHYTAVGTRSGEVYLYKDGSEIAAETATFADFGAFEADADGVVQLGHSRASGIGYASQDVDDIRGYTTGLTADEVANLYNNGAITKSGPAIPDASDLHARYSAKEDSQSTGSITSIPDLANDYDLSGNGSLVSDGINGYPSYRFTESEFMDVVFSALSQPNHIFIVAEQQTLLGTGDRYIIDGEAAFHGISYDDVNADGWQAYAGGNVVNGGSADLNPHIFDALFDGSASDLDLDGGDVASGDVGTNSLDGLTLGSDYSNTRGTDVLVGELLVYPQDKSGIRSDVVSYLNGEWEIF